MLGASGWQTFFRVTLPKVKLGVLYGVVLCNARAMGEFGAVSVVSGHIRGYTNTMPLYVEILYNDYNFAAAFAVASLLTILALATLALKSWLERRGAIRIPQTQADEDRTGSRMSIRLSGIRKHFGDFVALDDVEPRNRRRRADRAARSFGLGQNHAAPGNRRAGEARRRDRDGQRRATIRPAASAIAKSGSSSSITRCSAI